VTATAFDTSRHGRDGTIRPAHHWQSPHKLDRCCENCGTVATVFFDAASRAGVAPNA
jgi:hypothetical protein